MNDILRLAGGLCAIPLYIPILIGIWSGKSNQSFATWILWVGLDIIALIATILQNGSYLLLAVYCIGGTSVWMSLLWHKKYVWGKTEWFTLLLVLVCLCIWMLSSSWWALFASTIAVVISGAPQVKDSWKKPDRFTALIYLGYTVANGLSFLGRKSWQIEDWFYPAMCTLLCMVIAWVAFRRPIELVGRL